MKKLHLFLSIATGIILLFIVGTLFTPAAGMIAGASIASLAFIARIDGEPLNDYIRKCKEDRGEKYARLQELSELETLTADEEKEFDKLDAFIKKYDEYIGNLEAQAAREARRKTYRNSGPAIIKNVSKGDNDLGNFSFVRFFNEALKGKLTGLNAEMHQEAAREADYFGTVVKNFGIPTAILNFKRDLAAGTGASGGYNVVNEQLTYLEALKNALIFPGLGSDFLTNLKGSVPLTSENAVAAAVWVAENGDSTESSPTFTQTTMNPNRLSTFVDVSKLLLIQESTGIENRLRNQLINAAAQTLQTAAINGSGTAPEPEGILNTTGIGSVAIGDNGGAITWPAIVGLETEVSADNALMGSLGYVTNSKVLGKMKTTQKATGTGEYLVFGKETNGYPVALTNAIPSTLTKGSTSGSCSAMIFGNYRDLAFGQWGGLDILVNPYTKSKKGLIEYQIDGFYDVKVLRAQSFAAIKDITTT